MTESGTMSTAGAIPTATGTAGLTVVTDLRAVEPLEQEWRALALDLPATSYFCSPDWVLRLAARRWAARRARGSASGATGPASSTPSWRWPRPGSGCIRARRSPYPPG